MVTALRNRIAIAAVIVAAVALLVGGVRETSRILNMDKLVVLNSDLHRISNESLRATLPLEPVPRRLLPQEIEAVGELLHPANRHLVRDVSGRYFQFELRLDPVGNRKHVIATDGK